MRHPPEPPPTSGRPTGSTGAGSAAAERPLTAPDPRRALGRRGEEMAAEWYSGRGYQVVATNWRCRDGEIDLIVRRSRLFVFCEVKTRSSTTFGPPVESVTRTKQVRLRRLAVRWLQQECPVHPSGVRFDVVSILRGVLEVTEGAF